MSVSFIAKAKANRLAALDHILVRKSKLVSLHDFRGGAQSRANTPLKGFLSSRAAVEDGHIAA